MPTPIPVLPSAARFLNPTCNPKSTIPNPYPQYQYPSLMSTEITGLSIFLPTHLKHRPTRFHLRLTPCFNLLKDDIFSSTVSGGSQAPWPRVTNRTDLGVFVGLETLEKDVRKVSWVVRRIVVPGDGGIILALSLLWLITECSEEIDVRSAVGLVL